MTSQFGCLELLITRTFLSGPVKFEITRVDCTFWQTVQIQISWLLQKPTDLDLHCLQRQGVSGFSRTRVKTSIIKYTIYNAYIFAEKMWVAFAFAKASHIFQQKYLGLDTILSRPVNILTTNKLAKLTML